jgi:hypothetical protein
MPISLHNSTGQSVLAHYNVPTSIPGLETSVTSVIFKAILNSILQHPEVFEVSRLVYIFTHHYLHIISVLMGRYIPVYHTRTSFSCSISYQYLLIYITSTYLFPFFLMVYSCFAFKKYTGTFKCSFQVLDITA